MSERGATAKDADEIAFAGVRGQLELLTRGEVSAVELTELALRRAEELQPRLRPFRVLTAERALCDAERADQLRAKGHRAPLLGVPVAVKDDVDLAGETTPFGCGGELRPAESDCELVRRLRGAGAVIIGKTMTPEVGLWPFSESPAFGVTRNPWNPDHTPGGSSGGSAAAVAAGIVAVAFGSDGAGSVRIPAAWCNLVGVKPQRGRVSTWPDVDCFYGLVSYGPLARSTADAALALDAIAGAHPQDREPPPDAGPFSPVREPRALRVALSFATPFGVSDRVDPQIRAAVERIGRRLEELGHEVIELDPDYGLVGPALVPRGNAAVHRWLERVGDRSWLEPRTRVAAQIGRALSGWPLSLSRRAEPALRRRIGRVFDRADVVLTPTTAKLPPRVRALAGRSWWETANAVSAMCPFTFAWNVTGWPAISVPAGFSRERLPIGAQLLGREGDEHTLLGLAAQLEALEGWTRTLP